MGRWVKLDSDICTSPQVAKACEASPDAFQVWILLLLDADPYGVAQAHPAVLKGRTGALLPISVKRISQALDALEQVGLIVRYSDNGGRQLAWLPKWQEHQTNVWSRVGQPQYALPPGWSPSPEMVDAARRYPACPLAKWLWRNGFAGVLNDHSESSHGALSDQSVSTHALEHRTQNTENNNTSPPVVSPPEGGQPQPTKPRRLKIDQDHGLENNVDLDRHIKQPLYDLFGAQPEWRPGVYMRWRRAICHALDQGRLSLLDIVTAMCDPERCPDIGDMRKPDQWLARVIAQKRKADRPRIRSPVKPAQPGQRPSGKVVI